MDPRISLVTLGVSDLERSIAFYRDGLGLPDATGTLAHDVASPEDVDAVLAQAEAAGASILKPGQEVFWGGCSGYFADPDGFLWEVAWTPHFTVD